MEKTTRSKTYTEYKLTMYEIELAMLCWIEDEHGIILDYDKLESIVLEDEGAVLTMVYDNKVVENAAS